MANQDLIKYILEQNAQGIEPDTIKRSLVANGWSNQDIDEAFAAANLDSAVGTVEANNNSATNSSKKLVFIAIAAIILIASGVFAFIFFASPQKTLAKAILKTKAIKSFSYSGEIKGEMSVPDYQSFLSLLTTSAPLADLPVESKMVAGTSDYSLVQEKKPDPTQKFMVKFDGDSDYNDPAKAKAQLKLAIESNDFTGEAIVIDTRQVDGKYYFKPNNLPKIMGESLDQFKDQWVVIDPKEFTKDEAVKENKASPNLLDVLVKNNFIKISKTLKSEKLDNVDTYRYAVNINKKNLALYIVEASKLYNDTSGLTELSEIEKSLEEISFSDGQVWIGKKDGYFRKIQLTINYLPKDRSAGSGKINISANLTKINQPVNIETPSSAKSYTDLMDEIYSGQIGLAGGGDDSDKDGLVDEMERIYGTSTYDDDSDDDGFKDGDEVKNGYNPLGPGKLES